MPETKVRRGGKRGRKIGQNKSKCEKYRAAGRLEKNKIRRLKKHLKRVGGGDTTAREALVHLLPSFGRKAA